MSARPGDMNQQDSDLKERLEEIVALPIRGRVGFALAVAETVVGELAPDPKGLDLAREGLQAAWRWMNGQHVRAAEISQYIDGPTVKNVWRRQELYDQDSRFADKHDSMRAALLATILALAYAAREAYELEGTTQGMPEGMWKVSDGNLFGVVENARAAASRDGNAGIRQVSEFLIGKYGHHYRDAMGEPVTAEEILRQPSGRA